jgi:uncharacterized protein (TIGR02231 family)
MRSLALIAAFLPLPALAETYILNSRAAAAVIYPDGGSVSHIAILNAPAGAHRIVLPNLPKDFNLETLQVAAPGLHLSAMRLLQSTDIDTSSEETPAVQEARSKIKTTEAQIKATQERAARARVRREAAEATLEFLINLLEPKDLQSGAENLRAIAQMIGQETEAAQLAIREARATIEAAQEEEARQEEELERLKAALAELMPLTLQGPHLTLSVELSEPAENLPLKITFTSDEMEWVPSYTLRLFEDEITGAADLQIERSAFVWQGTGEDWDDIQLTLSTQRPSQALDPRKLWPNLRRIREETSLPIADHRLESAQSASLEKSPVLMEDAIQQGLSVSYPIKQPVDLPSDVDAENPAQLPLDTLNKSAEVFARAVPAHEEAGFLIARLRNDGIEPLLAGHQVQRYFNGSYIGTGGFPEIPAGAKAEIGFGQIPGLRITRKVLDRESGDQGIITRSNVSSENVQITVENLDTRAWKVELLARVPYSEQQDLQVSYRAQPRPDVVDVDDARGILQWNLELDPGDTRFFGTEVTLTWPDGFDLE